MILFGVIGGVAAAIAAAAGWFAGMYRARSVLEPRLFDSESRAVAAAAREAELRAQTELGKEEIDRLRDSESRAAAAEAREAELRAQTELAKNEIERLMDQRREAEKEKVAAETRAVELEKNWIEQKALLDDAKTKLSDSFKAVAGDVLAGSYASFLTLAQEKFKALKDEAAVDLDSRKTAIDAVIRPLSETLTAYQKETRELEGRLLREQVSVAEQLKASALTQAALQSETTKLVQALKPHQVRGRWGEMTLRRTVELAGMSSYCDFVEQESVETDRGRLRPDMIIKLPTGREIVIDAKVPLDGFLEAVEAPTDEGRHAALKKHLDQVNTCIDGLASKRYWAQFESSPEFVVLFMPNDSFLSAAVERDPKLIESAMQKKVVIATPVTLMALLHAVAYGWRQEQVAENARAISELGQEFSDRMAILAEHLKRVGGAMGKAVESYNAAVTSFESRILPSARRFKALGASGKREIEALEPIDQAPRLIHPLED